MTHPLKGRPKSAEHRAKIAAALRERYADPTHRATLSHRHYRHGHTANNRFSSTYKSWTSMRERCANPKSVGYPRYGGRGVSVCDRWQNFENFLADMGERPPGTTLDRIDSAGNYEPANCRWATPKEQARNRRKRK